jgi:glycosyltransferase involved in cell wall biosynthesis
VGSELPRTDLPTLVRAYARLVERPGLADVGLVLAGGPGPGTPELLRAIAGVPGRERIRRLGYVAEADLPGLYAGAAVLCIPSRAEGFGLPPLEAMAHGVPVVAANATALPEVIGLAGLLVPVGDPAAFATALERALTDPDLRAFARFAGPRRAAEFSWEAAAGAYVELYREVVGTRLHRPGVPG